MDLLELQERCRTVAGEAEDRAERREAHMKAYSPPEVSTGRWDHLKDYPGQWLPDEEFARRREAYLEGQEMARLAGVEAYESRGSRRQSPWRVKGKRR